MKYRYKKMLSLMGLVSMLALTGCGNSTISENEEQIESEISDECLENHLDVDSLKVENLSDGSKYIKDASLFYSIRERFLNNNSIMNFKNIEFDNSYFDILKDNSDYLYLFDNDKIRDHINYYMTKVSTTDVLEENQERKNYIEDENSVDIRLGYQFNNEKIYTFSISTELADHEMIYEDFLTDVIDYSKYMHCEKRSNDRFKIIEQYKLSSIDKSDLNKISIDIYFSYYLDKNLITEENYSCDKYDARITLNNGEESLEGELTEEHFNKLSSLLTKAAKEEKSVEEFLEENEELMIELYGEEYQRFIEITKTIQYTKKYI